MKTKKFIIAFAAMLVLTIAMPVKTEASPPPWAPAHGYREKTRQIYFPQQNFYYDLHRGVYMYINGRNWVTSNALPPMYRNMNLHIAPQVQLFINNNRPYMYNNNHRSKYWNSSAQNDYYKRINKNHKAYRKDIHKADKKYYKIHKKTAKKQYKKNKNKR